MWTVARVWLAWTLALLANLPSDAKPILESHEFDIDSEMKSVHSCKYRKRVMGLESFDEYIIVEATKGQTVKLECHYW